MKVLHFGWTRAEQLAVGRVQNHMVRPRTAVSIAVGQVCRKMLASNMHVPSVTDAILDCDRVITQRSRKLLKPYLESVLKTEGPSLCISSSSSASAMPCPCLCSASG